MQPILEIHGLGKEYTLTTASPYISLRESIHGSFKKLWGASKKREKFWALQDLDLTIQPGERLGIIGKNGAGKSTLLKLISRITPPSAGHIKIRGRVGSLLEVGTGFHAELSGRENIYLNGSILGLKKSEIDRQLEAIVDFSAVSRFIDMPLKHFSTGMQLRLAFAVAAHLDPELLLIDEVLAVGDAEFQQKCIQKMDEVSREQGRTILFVSHQLNAIQKLCTRGIWIEGGTLQFAGTVDETIEHYTTALQKAPATLTHTRESLQEQDVFASVDINSPVITIGDDLGITIRLSDTFAGRKLVLNINLYNQTGDFISHILNEDDGFSTGAGAANAPIHVTLKSLNLLPGKYSLSFWAGLDMFHGLDKLENVLSFEVSEQNPFTKRIAPFPAHSKMVIRSEWNYTPH